MAIDPTGGRTALEAMLAGQSARTQRLAQRVARETAAAVTAGMPTIQAVAQAMDRVGVAQAVRSMVGESVVQSLAMGNGIWPTIEGRVDLPRLSTVALQHAWDDSGMTLSARIHGTDAAMRQDVVDAVQGFVQAKSGAWQTARRIYDGYGFGGAIHQNKLPDLPKDLDLLVSASSRVLSESDLAQLKASAKQMTRYADQLATSALAASYRQISERLEKGLTHGLERLVATATEEKARFHADRILRTESARAWGQGFDRQCNDDPDVAGWRWETSGAHKVWDICDFHARANLFGMGPGRYPKDRHPRYGAHPFCLCQISMVFRGETHEPRDQVEAGGKQALQEMTPAQRGRVLTIKGDGMFQGGADWRKIIRNWDPPSGSHLSPGAKAVLEAVAPALEFSPAKTIAEAEAYARARNFADQISYKGLHLDAANEINRALDVHLTEFPELRKGLQFVGSADERNRQAKALRKKNGWPSALINKRIPRFSELTLAASTDSRHLQYDGVQGIAFSTRLFGPENDVIAERWKNGVSGIGKFHPPGKSAAFDTASHEIGHQLDALYGLRTDEDVMAIWKAASGSELGKTKAAITRNVSGYAAEGGIVEGIAEMWAEAVSAEFPRDFAKQLRERILNLRREN